jgi:hypothetical protein
VYPENSLSLYENYLESTSEPYGYLLLDLCQDSPDTLRFRTKIFPDEIRYVFAPVKDEEDKIELAYSTSIEKCKSKITKSNTS